MGGRAWAMRGLPSLRAQRGNPERQAPSFMARRRGLPRRCAPRNDGGRSRGLLVGPDVLFGEGLKMMRACGEKILDQIGPLVGSKADTIDGVIRRDSVGPKVSRDEPLLRLGCNRIARGG